MDYILELKNECQLPDSGLYTRHCRRRHEMAPLAHLDFVHLTAVERFKIRPVEYLCNGPGNRSAIIEQHEDVVAETVGPTNIVQHHRNRFSLSCQLLKQHHDSELMA